MTELRKQFEGLPEIAEILRQKDIEYANYYGGKIYMSDCGPHGYLNGAWYAFQEQQKKIDSLLDHVCGSFEDFK